MFSELKTKLIAPFVLTCVLVAGCLSSPTSPEIPMAFLVNFDLVDEEEFLFQGRGQINCARCEWSGFVLTDKAIYLFAQRSYTYSSTPEYYTKQNLFRKLEYSNILGVEGGGLLPTTLYLERIGEKAVDFGVAGWSNKPYEIIKKKIDEVTDSIRRIAQQGDAEAQYQLGYRYNVWGGMDYLRGEEVISENDNIKEAVKWYRVAAEQDHVVACRTLGDMYFSGEYVWKDIEEATKWYLIASDQGDSSVDKRLELIKRDHPGIWARMKTQQ